MKHIKKSQKKRMPWEGLSYEEKLAKNVYCVFSLPKEEFKTPKTEISSEPKTEQIVHADRLDILSQHIFIGDFLLKISDLHIETEYTD